MLARNCISDLLQPRPGPCVSLFVSLHHADAQGERNRGRFQHLVRSIERELASQGSSRWDLANLSHRVERLRDRPVFGRYPSDSVACFMAGDLLRVERMPLAVKPQYYVQPRFVLKPVLPMLAENQRFFVLALGHDACRLFEATADSMCEVPLDALPAAVPPGPASASDAPPSCRIVPRVRTTTTVLQRRSATASPSASNDVRRFLHAVDRRVHALLGELDAPLVLACIGFLAVLYGPVNSYRQLLPVTVPGNPATWSEDQLHALARDIAEPFLRRGRDLARQNYEDVRGTPRSSDDVAEIVAAADLGRVDTLLVTRSVARCGAYDPRQHRVHFNGHGQDQDLVEIAADKTLQHGGKVYDLERDQVPGGSGLAAIFRMPHPT